MHFHRMDPLKVLPAEIFENILTHLNKNDIMQASLVSKHWYRVTGKSKKCMSKLCAYYGQTQQTSDIKYIMNSERLYQHLSLFCHQDNIHNHTTLLRNMRSIVNKFSGSLITLKAVADLQRTFELPRLKELTFFYFFFRRHCYHIETQINSRIDSLKFQLETERTVMKQHLADMKAKLRNFMSSSKVDALRHSVFDRRY